MEISGSVYLFCLRPEKPYLSKFSPQNQNCHFELKIGTKTNSNMKNSMVMLKMVKWIGEFNGEEFNDGLRGIFRTAYNTFKLMKIVELNFA